MKIAMLFFALSSVAMLSAQPVIIPVDKLVLLEAEQATLSSDRAEVTAIPVGKNRQGVTLAPGVEEKNSLDRESPPRPHLCHSGRAPKPFFTEQQSGC